MEQTTIDTALTEIESMINTELEETIPEGETELDISEIQYANGLEFALICIRKWKLDNISKPTN